MAPRKKAGWGYRVPYLLSHDAVRVYSDQAIDELARQYDIDDLTELKHRVVRPSQNRGGFLLRICVLAIVAHHVKVFPVTE